MRIFIPRISFRFSNRRSFLLVGSSLLVALLSGACAVRFLRCGKRAELQAARLPIVMRSRGSTNVYRFGTWIA